MAVDRCQVLQGPHAEHSRGEATQCGARASGTSAAGLPLREHEQMMTIEYLDTGVLRIKQRLMRPVVYLDHWAVRKFSSDASLQKRFIAALRAANGTWLFSHANLMEFTAMTDPENASATESMLTEALPHLHVADTFSDAGYLLELGAPAHADAPDRNWLRMDLERRAENQGGTLTMHRFVRDVIDYRDFLLPEFKSMKKAVMSSMAADLQLAARQAAAKKFTPKPGMTLRKALFGELLRGFYIINKPHGFVENDVVDMIHAAPSLLTCDLVLLDGAWCHKARSATNRLRKGGITGKLAKPFSSKQLITFLLELEAHRTPPAISS